MAKRSQKFSPSGLTPRSKICHKNRSKTTAARALLLPREEGGAQHTIASSSQLSPEWSREEEVALLVHMSRQVDAGVITGWPAPRTQGESFWIRTSEAVSAVSGQSCRSGIMLDLY